MQLINRWRKRLERVRPVKVLNRCYRVNRALWKTETVRPIRDPQSKRLEACNAINIMFPLLPGRLDQRRQVQIMACIVACDFELLFRFAQG